MIRGEENNAKSQGEVKVKRHRQIQIQVRQGQLNEGRIGLNVEHYKTTVSAIFRIQVTLLGCYVPFFPVTVLRIYNGKKICIT